MSWVAVGVAAVGMAKSEFIDRPAAERQRKLAAQTELYSPWTGMKAGKINEPDTFGAGLKYGATGAMIGNSLADQSIDQEKALENTSGFAANGSTPESWNGMLTDEQYGKMQNPWGMSLNGKK